MPAEAAPAVAVSAVALDPADRVLLVRRGHGPAAGTWALPGGRVRHAETLAEAVVREIAEETGLECVLRRFLGWVERVEDPEHFLIMAFLVDLADPEAAPRAGDDATEAAWWPRDDLDALRLAPGVVELLDEAGLSEGAELLGDLDELPSPERP